MTIRLSLKQGDIVRFMDGDKGLSVGTVNGPIQIYENGETYVPVYVVDEHGDRCLVVHSSNLVRKEITVTE